MSEGQRSLRADAPLNERIRDEWDLLGLMSYHGTSWGSVCADLNEDDVNTIRALFKEAGLALDAALTRLADLEQQMMGNDPNEIHPQFDHVRRALLGVPDPDPTPVLRAR